MLVLVPFELIAQGAEEAIPVAAHLLELEAIGQQNLGKRRDLTRIQVDLPPPTAFFALTVKLGFFCLAVLLRATFFFVFSHRAPSSRWPQWPSPSNFSAALTLHAAFTCGSTLYALAPTPDGDTALARDPQEDPQHDLSVYPAPSATSSSMRAARRA